MTTATQSCPQCGAALPAAAPAGLCPRCLATRLLTAPHEAAAETPADFGDFVLGELLGRGGMGAVYRARQKSLDRDVALKLLPLDLLDDEEFLERFEREARLMARLTHPAIARVFEAGISDGGQPYLAMELVAGEPITAFARSRGLRLRARLELFVKVCDAVQHAHQRGIIHRDLKPSNILVAEHDGAAQVKVIDFGLARPSSDVGADAAVWRSQAHAVGTPAYMSPEQAAGGEVDTRTDVYSLGVLLCELLAGAVPFADAQFQGASRDDIARLLRETPTPRPSELLHSTSFSEPPKVRELRGDLDAICLRALAKNPAERYPAVTALAEDIARHLRFEPVSAVAPTVGYRVGKFARRNRALLGITTGIFFTLAGASIFSASQAQTARHQRDRAEIARAQAERVKAFLGEMLAAPAPDRTGRDVRVVDVLAQAAQNAERELDDDPEVLAAVRVTLGNTYYMLSLYDEAEPLLRAAVDDHRRLFGNGSAATGTALVALGSLYSWTSRFEEATALLAEAATIQRQHLPASGYDLACALQNLGAAFVQWGRPAAAEAPLREAIVFAEKANGVGCEGALTAMGDLFSVLRATGRSAEARVLLERVIARLRERPEERMNLATSLAKWGDVAMEIGDLAGAERALNECLELRRALFDESSPPVAAALGRLAMVHLRQGDLERAGQEAQQGLAMQRERLKPGHREFAFTLSPLGLVLFARGQPAEAAPLLAEALELMRKYFASNRDLIAELEAKLKQAREQ